jgi:hypothetical protein
MNKITITKEAKNVCRFLIEENGNANHVIYENSTIEIKDSILTVLNAYNEKQIIATYPLGIYAIDIKESNEYIIERDTGKLVNDVEYWKELYYIMDKRYNDFRKKTIKEFILWKINYL